MNNPESTQPAQPVTLVPNDPLTTSLQNKATGAVIGFVRQNPWKAAAMVAAAGLVFALWGNRGARTVA